ncbi:hypothetical protein H8356DRAFT_1333391 [Neocallimastix lanati (nom. inval.)]|nr:hypothetical protein H8356DRAFT_1333391 [Neocallimastix sp. JGI-2020a]
MKRNKALLGPNGRKNFPSAGRSIYEKIKLNDRKQRQLVDNIYKQNSSSSTVPFFVGIVEFLTNVIPLICRSFRLMVKWYSVESIESTVTKNVYVEISDTYSVDNTKTEIITHNNGRGVIIEEWEKPTTLLPFSTFLIKIFPTGFRDKCFDFISNPSCPLRRNSSVSVYALPLDLQVFSIAGFCASLQIKCFCKWRNSKCIIKDLINHISSMPQKRISLNSKRFRLLTGILRLRAAIGSGRVSDDCPKIILPLLLNMLLSSQQQMVLRLEEMQTKSENRFAKIEAEFDRFIPVMNQWLEEETSSQTRVAEFRKIEKYLQRQIAEGKGALNKGKKIPTRSDDKGQKINKIEEFMDMYYKEFEEKIEKPMAINHIKDFSRKKSTRHSYNNKDKDKKDNNNHNNGKDLGLPTSSNKPIPKNALLKKMNLSTKDNQPSHQRGTPKHNTKEMGFQIEDQSLTFTNAFGKVLFRTHRSPMVLVKLVEKRTNKIRWLAEAMTGTVILCSRFMDRHIIYRKVYFYDQHPKVYKVACEKPGLPDIGSPRECVSESIYMVQIKDEEVAEEKIVRPSPRITKIINQVRNNPKIKFYHKKGNEYAGENYDYLTAMVIQGDSIEETINKVGLEKLLIIGKIINKYYRELLEAFNKETPETLFERRIYNCNIDLKPDESFCKGRIYSIIPRERNALNEYFGKNLDKGFIRKSESPAGYLESFSCEGLLNSVVFEIMKGIVNGKIDTLSRIENEKIDGKDFDKDNLLRPNQMVGINKVDGETIYIASATNFIDKRWLEVNCLLIRKENPEQVYVSMIFRKTIIPLNHDSEHVDVKPSIKKFLYAKMRKDISEYDTTVRISVAELPWQEILLDSITDLPVKKNEENKLHFDDPPEWIQTSNETVEALQLPIEEPNYLPGMERITRYFQTEINYATKSYYETIGHVKRNNAYMETYLRCLVGTYDDESRMDYLFPAEFGYNNSIHVSTKHYPFLILFNYLINNSSKTVDLLHSLGKSKMKSQEHPGDFTNTIFRFATRNFRQFKVISVDEAKNSELKSISCSPFPRMNSAFNVIPVPAPTGNKKIFDSRKYHGQYQYLVYYKDYKQEVARELPRF